MPECAKRVSRKERGALARLGGLRARSVPFANCIREPLANFPTVVEVANCGGLASGPSSILVVIQATLYPSYMSLDAVTMPSDLVFDRNRTLGSPRGTGCKGRRSNAHGVVLRLLVFGRVDGGAR
jgi:hypothetical protein